MTQSFQMTAKTLFGLEDLLAKELKQLGAQDVESGSRMVQFRGDLALMYKANLACRTAIKILKPIQTFSVQNEQALYDAIYQIDWSKYLQPDQTLAIDATVFSEVFTHSKYIALKSKDAIVDQFRNRTGTRPSVNVDSPDLRINIHINRNECTVSLDSSGTSLHQRGYKTSATIAPLNEVLAAGLLMLAGWEGQCDFLDPMCGSGTILTEAAMIACNIPANAYRPEFAFERWPDYDNALFESTLDELMQQARPCAYTITGYDIDVTAIRKAEENAKRANLNHTIQIHHDDFFDTHKVKEGPLFILFNPPYDERIGIHTETFYESIGSTLKHHYPGTTAWMITANLEALKYVGLKPSQKIKMYNGALEARLVRYDMYAGSRKGNPSL